MTAETTTTADEAEAVGIVEGHRGNSSGEAAQLIDAEVLDHNFFHALGDIAHGCLILVLLNLLIICRQRQASMRCGCPQLASPIA
jgi:hypothetical protein